MKQYSCLIADGTESDVLTLKRLLAQTPILSKVDSCDTAADTLKLALTEPYDLVFVDFKLPGMPCPTWLSTLPRQPPIIVMSAHAEHALPCHDLSVADFLLKPFELSRLMRAVNRALSIRLTERSQMYPYGIFLHASRRLQQFLFDEIQYIEAHGANAKIFEADQPTTVNESISWIESQLPSQQFVRIQKSFIVNLKRVTALEARHIWIGQTKLSIGQQYRDQLRQFVARHID